MSLSSRARPCGGGLSFDAGHDGGSVARHQPSLLTLMERLDKSVTALVRAQIAQTAGHPSGSEARLLAAWTSYYRAYQACVASARAEGSRG